MQTNIGYNNQFAGIKPPGMIQIDKTLTKPGYAADAAAAGLIVQQAKEAASHYPIVGTDGHWYVWSVEYQQYVDTGAVATLRAIIVEELPRIGESGIIYLVPVQRENGDINYYDEYIWVDIQGEEFGGRFEPLGSEAGFALFVATFGVTTFEELVTAFQNGKSIVCTVDGKTYPCTYAEEDTLFAFGGIDGKNVIRITAKNTDPTVWGLKHLELATQQDIDNISERINGLEEEISSVSSKADELETRVDGIDQSIEDINNDIQGIHEDLTDVHTDLTGVHQEITGINEDLENVHQDITQLNQDVEALEDNISQLDERVSELETAGFLTEEQADEIYVRIEDQQLFIAQYDVTSFEVIRENCVKKVVYCRVDGRPFLLTNFNEDGATFTLVQRQGGVTTSRIAFVDSSNHWSLSASIELAKGSDVTQLQQDVYGIQQQLGDVDVTALQQQVDNVENDLAENYYRKEDTYDRDEVEEKIRAAIKDINYMTSNSSDPEDQDWLWGGD